MWERPIAGEGAGEGMAGEGMAGEAERLLSLLRRRRSSPSLDSGERGEMAPVVEFRFRVVTWSVGTGGGGDGWCVPLSFDSASCVLKSSESWECMEAAAVYMSFDLRLANNEDFSLGGSRFPNMTEYLSISTHGIVTSKQGVRGGAFPASLALGFCSLAVLGGSGISGVGSRGGLVVFQLNNPLPKTRFHPAVFGGSGISSLDVGRLSLPLLPFLDRPLDFGRDCACVAAANAGHGDSTTNGSSGSRNPGDFESAMFKVSTDRNPWAISRDGFNPSVGLPSAIPITHSSSGPIATPTSFSANDGRVCCGSGPRLDEGLGGKAESLIGGGGTRFCAVVVGVCGGAGEPSPKNIDILRFRSAGFAAAGGFHSSESPSAIMDSRGRVLEMLLLRPSLGVCVGKFTGGGRADPTLLACDPSSPTPPALLFPVVDCERCIDGDNSATGSTVMVNGNGPSGG